MTDSGADPANSGLTAEQRAEAQAVADAAGRVAAEVRRLAQRLRTVESSARDEHAVRVDGCDVDGWVSLARLSYELGRGLIAMQLRATSLTAGSVAWQYDRTAELLDIEATVLP